MPSVRIKRGTRAQLTAAAGSNGLKQGELYHVTDEGRIDLGTGVGASAAMATKAEVDGKEPSISAGTTAQYWRGDKTWRDFFADVRATTLTGLSTAVNAAIDAADTVLAALGKLQAQITGHVEDTSGAHTATSISNTPAGGISATTVQAAINELDSEKIAKAGGTGIGALTVAGLLSSSGGIGYTTGAGGTAAQPTSNTSNLALNKPSGTITMFGPLGVNEDVVFTVFNSFVGTNDLVFVQLKTGALAVVLLEAEVSSAGNFRVRAKNLTASPLAMPLDIKFEVRKGATS